MNTDVFFSEWLFPLSAGARLAWVCLLLYVKAQGVGGKAKVLTSLIASRQWLVGEEDVVQMLSAAKTDDAVRVENGEWVIVKWADFQEPSTDRVKRHRDMKRNETNETLGNPTETETETPTKTRTKIFVPPTIEEVESFMREAGFPEPSESAFRWWHFYNGKNWMVGKNKMSKWKSAVQTWKKKEANDGCDEKV